MMGVHGKTASCVMSVHVRHHWSEDEGQIKGALP